MHATAPVAEIDAVAEPAPQGWQARLALGFAPRRGRTRLVSRQQLGPLTIQRPFYPEGSPCHSYLLHPPGGVVGGDQLQIDIELAADAHALITTPGATKFYRSGDRLACQRQQLRVASGALLEWLPQETIFFPGAEARLETEIHIAPGGRFIGWEMHCFGRPALGECFNSGQLDLRTQLYLDDQLVLLDQLRLNADNLHQAGAGLRGYPMFGCLLAVGCGEAELDLVRELLNSTSEQQIAGVTLLDDGPEPVLVVRVLGEQAQPMLACFSDIWLQLRQHWLGMAASPPRIWAT